MFVSFFYAGLVDAADIILKCGGSNQQCNGPCVQLSGQLKSFSKSEDDNTLIHSAWRGGAFRWDDDASTNWSYSKPGYGGSWSDHSQNGNNRGWLCGCGDVDNCPGVSWYSAIFLSNGVTSLAGRDSISISLNAINKHTASFNPVYGESGFGYAFESCGYGRRTNSSYNSCVNISGSINANPPNPPDAPANVGVSWTSNSTSSAIVYLLLESGADTGKRLFSSGPNGSGTFSNLSAGNYKVCLNAKDGLGNEVNTNPLACDSFSIKNPGPPPPPPPSATISASPNPIQVCSPDVNGVTTITVSSNVNYRVRYRNPGGSPVWFTGTEPPTSGTRNHPTGDWVKNGGRFDVVNYSTGSAGATLASVYVSHTSSGCPQKPRVDIKANDSNGPITISHNGSADLSWTLSFAQRCEYTSIPSGAPNWDGKSQLLAGWQYPESLPGGSQSTGPLAQSYTYRLICYNPSGSDSDTVTVNVPLPPTPTATIKANEQINQITIPHNSSVTISWTCTNSISGTVSPTGWTGLTGSQITGNLTSRQTYTLLCNSASSSDTAGVTVNVQDPTLSVNLTANPNSGPYPVNTTLQATTSGTVTGTVNYYFWWNCSTITRNVFSAEQSCGVLPVPSPGSCSSNANGYRCNAVSSLSRSVAHVYNSSARAKVIVERGAASPDEDRVDINVTNSPPTVTFVNVTQPKYCSSGPAATVNWGYSDPEGTAQTAYQVQIDDSPALGSPNVDSEKVFDSGTSYFGGLGVLLYDTTYRSRVRVWDGAGLASGWITSSPWTTPEHPYPVVDFIFDPANPAANQVVQFTDQTVFSDGQPDTDHSWNWLFQALAGSPSSTLKNPTHQYPSAGMFNVQLTSTDDDGFQCSLSKLINVQEPIPIFKEVAP